MTDKVHLLKPLTPKYVTWIEDNIFYTDAKLDFSLPVESWEIEDIVKGLIGAGFRFGVDFEVEH